MTNLFAPSAPAGIGLQPGNGWLIVKNVTATAMRAGDIVMLALGQTGDDSDVTSTTPGSTSGVFGCVIQPNSVANTRTGQFLILLEAIAAGATGKAAATGVVPAILQLGVGDFALGAPLAAFTVSGSSGNGGVCPLSALGSASTRGEKIIGYLMQSASQASSAATNTTMGTIWFNGVGAGFGQNAG